MSAEPPDPPASPPGPLYIGTLYVARGDEARTLAEEADAAARRLAAHALARAPSERAQVRERFESIQHHLRALALLGGFTP